MRINYNASAVITNKSLNNNDSMLSQSLQRLSSGLKINKAMDNPAGLAIAHRMDAQVKGLDIGKRNSNDGISVISTAEGALAEMSSVLQRMNQLAVQAANGSNTDGDRELLIAPLWGTAKTQVINDIRHIMKEKGIHQGDLL